MTDERLRRNALGFLEVVDRPTPQELTEYYAQVYYQNETGNYRKSYSPEEIEVIELRIAQRAAKACELLGDYRSGSLLDVGCGEGFTLRFFDRKGWQVAGIDYSLAGVQQMNPDYAGRVEQGDVFALLETFIAANKKKYDLIWLGNVLEHVLDPVGLLSTLRRLVSPNGLLVVTVPNDGNAYHEELYATGAIPNRFWIAIPDHMSYFTAESLRQTAQATEWDCLALQGDFPIDWFLAHDGSNYIVDSARGSSAHRARLSLERLIGQAGTDAANRFYTALADVGFGRNLTAFLRPKPERTEK